MAIYGTLEGWRAWATERGNSAPAAASDADANAALARASDYIRLRYISALRPECSDDMLVPGYDGLTLGELGTYIAATFEMTAPGFFSATYTPSQQKALTRVGDIGWTVVGNGADGTFGSFPTSNMLEALFRKCAVDPDANMTSIWAIGS